MMYLLPPILTACFAWWFSTGAILWLMSGSGPKGPRADRVLLIGSVTVAALSVAVLLATANVDTSLSAYLGFIAALAIWGVLEISFLSGAITGPSRAPCPPDARGYRRFLLATATVIYHEILIAVVALGAIVGLAGAVNPAGPLTLGALACLRLSAKLNIFLGAPEFSDAMLPSRLSYLKTYFHRGPLNPLFPFSIIGGAIAACMLGAIAIAAPQGGATGTATALVFALVLLGLLEHVFMMTPLDDTALWRWSSRRDAKKSG